MNEKKKSAAPSAPRARVANSDDDAATNKAFRPKRPPVRRRREVYAVDVGPGGEALVMRIENPSHLAASRGCTLAGDVVDMVAALVADFADPRKRTEKDASKDDQQET